jgi:pyridoxal phosphate enzyme (YggS family)
MPTIALRLQAVRDRIAAAALHSGRTASSIMLLAVSKNVPASYIEEAASAGQRAFGESYVQEGVKKITALDRHGLEWHFIGPLQSNKTRVIAEHYAWVHGIDRTKVAERLNAARPEHLPPLNVCIQVNVSGEGSKSGVPPGEERRIAEAVAALPRLRLRGLMTIPEPTPDESRQRKRYAHLRDLSEGLIASGYALDTLSMGMSGDLESAIAEGATIVRVGTAIFGARETL